MKSRHALQTLAAALLLVGCVSPSPLVKSPRVEPVVDVRHSGSQADGYYQLGRFFQGKGRADQAIDAYRKALVLDPGLAEAHSAIGAVFAGQGNLSAAAAEFELAIAIDPLTSRFHSNLGYVLYLDGKANQGVAALERAVALDATNVRARNNLGLALAAQSESDRSNAAFARAADAAAATPVLRAETLGESLSPPASGVSNDVTVLVARPGPAGWSVISEQPSTVKVVELAPNVLALEWDETTVVARPAIAADFGGTLRCSVEVSNGSGVTGMARKVGGLFAAVGVPRARLTNQKPYDQRFTEIQYREGCLAAAAALSAMLPGAPQVTSSDRLRPGTDVRIVLGRDLPPDVALIPSGADGQPWTRAAATTLGNFK
ncbi:MAG: tetratricopeptide repeat protein [Burkholderiaceae bacterium]